MPQVDLETQLSGGNDSKVACETQIEGNPPPEKLDIPENPPDLPAESFYLSREEELDWVDRNAFYERKESTKGNSTSVPISNTNLNLNSNSQRSSLSLKSKASLIGLPKPQKSCFVFTTFRHNFKPTTARFFPKRTPSSVSVSEPTSPKVSCIGRVRTKKQRSLRQINLSPSTETSTTPGPKKSGFWSCFLQALWFGCRKNQAVDVEDTSTESPPRKSMTGEKRKTLSMDPVADPPGLGGVKRFASGRRSDLVVAEFDSGDRGLV